MLHTAVGCTWLLTTFTSHDDLRILSTMKKVFRRIYLCHSDAQISKSGNFHADDRQRKAIALPVAGHACACAG